MAARLAMDGGEPLRCEPFPAWPIFDENEEKLLLEVLHSGKWGTLNGSKVIEFEGQFASFQHARFGICVPNGTLALELALKTANIGPGDEVITTPYTFIATSSSVFATGARPVFTDIDLNTFNLDPAGIEAAITPRTRAILPVHLGGRPADMDAILNVAQKHGLLVIEDACQAWGSEWRGRRVGAIGDMGAFSFQSSKNITAGEGGIVITNNPEMAERCWSLHNVGRIRSGAWYQHELLGANYRMSEWEGAVLQAQLQRIPQHMPLREENTRYLRAQLKSRVPGIIPLDTDLRISACSHHLFIMRYQSEYFGGHSRSEFIRALTAEGIDPISSGYVPLHQSPAIRRGLDEDTLTRLTLPAAEQAGRETIWLNQTPFLGTHADMNSIIDALLKIQSAWA
jgi:dTDP-4-amino-4,6-dideoxygalactose transaminase